MQAASGSQPVVTSNQGKSVMANENRIVVIGNLVDDPELRFTNNGTPVANFRVTVTHASKRGDVAGRRHVLFFA